MWFDKLVVFTFVAAVENVGESVGAFEVEKGSDREDQEQADQQCSQKKRGSHTWPSCSKSHERQTQEAHDEWWPSSSITTVFHLKNWLKKIGCISLN